MTSMLTSYKIMPYDHKNFTGKQKFKQILLNMATLQNFKSGRRAQPEISHTRPTTL